MTEIGQQREKQYWHCPKCGRTILILYNDPEPLALIQCDNGHLREPMEKV